MKKIIIALLFTIFLIIPSTLYSKKAYIHSIISVYFSPDGGATNAIIKQIKKAKKEIYVQSYIFTSKHIAQALVNAFNRGVKVIIILDKSELKDKWSMKNFFLKEGIPVYIAYKYKIFHDKIIIIDDKEIITGSFNFTYSAEHYNAENMLIIPSKSLAQVYLKNFYLHLYNAKKITLP
jgi:phosphatidylserine/phosphatidylglycerophosphate/cardiolipin synthase-like enzyme